MLKQEKPIACSSCICSAAMPQPVSFIMIGTSVQSCRRDRLSRIRENCLSPSGIISSWVTFRWISRASARIISTAALASSGVARALTLAKKMPSGFSSRITAKVSACCPSLTEPYWDPTARATPASPATAASFRLISFTRSAPPVMASIITGTGSLRLPIRVDISTLSESTGVRQLCRKRISSRPVLRSPSPNSSAYRI